MLGHFLPRHALAATLLIVFSVQGFAATGKRVVLPDSVTPLAYRIDFTPDIGALTFKGTVEIDVQVNRPTHTFELNAADLVIDNVVLAGEPNKPAVSLDDKIQTVTFTFDHPVTTGAHTLKIAYHGRIYQSASGLFALDYQDPRGGKAPARALFTQFENSDARRFVPCWDEPGIKSTFELTATLPAGLMPLSNMPVAGTDPLPHGLQRVRFAKSPKMSTYLLFFGAGDFERVHRTVAGVDVGIVVKHGDTAHAAYALDAAVQLLPFFNDYFGVPYPLPKLDLIAGPGSSQFFGAMENWGAIFYFEYFLLIDSRISTQTDQQSVYSVIAHEMAHQW
ncbi:MAG TPA: M1 family metallopeptidase, partial [Steroidobacteraceae bacterium]|nr:M1 family metallopeptidase [Steroidobacteraceae bacterium]